MILTAWRIVKRKHADTAFSGAGARLLGGRWNSPGRPVVYAAGSASLALLEILVHLESTLLPHYVGIPVRFDSDLVSRLDPDSLPAHWSRFPAPEVLQRIGDGWLIEAETPVLRVPSAVMPLEWNFLLNPRHPRFDELDPGEARGFAPDLRLLSLERHN